MAVDPNLTVQTASPSIGLTLTSGPVGPSGNPTFGVSANTTTPPAGARIGDYIMNISQSPITIGNLTNRLPGDIVCITNLPQPHAPTAPFTVVAAGAVRGARGPQGVPGPIVGSRYAGNVLSDNPVAYWRLGENGRPWLDSSPAAATATPLDLPGSGATTNDAIRVAGAIRNDTDGAVAFNVNASSSAIGETPFHPRLAIPCGPTDPGITIELWLRQDIAAGGITTFLNRYGATGWGDANYYINRYAGGNVALIMGGAPGNAGFTGPVIPASVFASQEWVHCVFTYSADGGGRVYANSRLIGTNAYVGERASASTRGWNVNVTTFVLGLDEMAIYNYALPERRIKAHWEASETEPPVAQRTTAVWFPGNAANFALTPDSAKVRSAIADGFDIRWQAQMRVDTGEGALFGVGDSVGNRRAFYVTGQATGDLNVGVARASTGIVSWVAPANVLTRAELGSPADGAWYTARYRYDAATGGWDSYRSVDDGQTWIRIRGASSTTALGGEPVFSGNGDTIVGRYPGATNFNRAIGWVEVRDVTGEQVLASVDFTTPWPGRNWRDPAGNDWRLNPPPETTDQTSALWFPGAGSDNVTTPVGSIATNLASGFDVRWRAQLRTAAIGLFALGSNATSSISLRAQTAANANLTALLSTTGTDPQTSIANFLQYADFGSPPDYSWYTARLTWQASTGAWTSFLSDDNGQTWRQIRSGTTTTTGPLFNPTGRSLIVGRDGDQAGTPATTGFAWFELRRFDTAAIVAACDFQTPWSGTYRDTANNNWVINGTGTRWTTGPLRTTPPGWRWTPGPDRPGLQGPPGAPGNAPFTTTANLTTPPEGSRVGDLIINTGTGPVTIGNLTNQAVGAVVRIQNLDPFTVFASGSVKQ